MNIKFVALKLKMIKNQSIIHLLTVLDINFLKNITAQFGG